MKTRAMKAVRIPGIIVDINTSKVVEIFSCSTNGNDMSGSTGEKGRWLGLAFQKLQPIAAMPLGDIVSVGLLNQLYHAHDRYPVKDIGEYHSI